MNVSNYVTEFAAKIPPAVLPRSIWQFYCEYLWYYQPDSWVFRVASAFRVLSILVILPILVLALLDISSYAIARTLGVIDDVKASTSDKETIHRYNNMPSILVHDTDMTSPEAESMTTSPDTDGYVQMRTKPVEKRLKPDTFYASETDDNHNLKLSGIDVFSPAASQPPSPTLSRRPFRNDGKFPMVDVMTPIENDGSAVKRRAKTTKSMPET